MIYFMLQSLCFLLDERAEFLSPKEDCDVICDIGDICDCDMRMSLGLPVIPFIPFLPSKTVWIYSHFDISPRIVIVAFTLFCIE